MVSKDKIRGELISFFHKTNFLSSVSISNQWYYYRYTNAPNDLKDIARLPIPPPPTQSANLRNDNGKLNLRITCPICRRKRKNETLVPISGYVYCYKCIVSHLRSENTKDGCPVTGLPVTEEDLVRLFPPGNE